MKTTLIFLTLVYSATSWAQSDFVRSDAAKAARDYVKSVQEFVQYAQDNQLRGPASQASSLAQAVRQNIARSLRGGDSRESVQRQLGVYVHPGVAKVWKAITNSKKGNKGYHIEAFRVTEIYKVYLMEELKYIKGANKPDLEYPQRRTLRAARSYGNALGEFLNSLNQNGESSVASAVRKLRKTNRENFVQLVDGGYPYVDVYVGVAGSVYPAAMDVWDAIQFDANGDKGSLISSFKAAQAKLHAAVAALHRR